MLPSKFEFRAVVAVTAVVDVVGFQLDPSKCSCHNFVKKVTFDSRPKRKDTQVLYLTL
jgi:hypothetical protein